MSLSATSTKKIRRLIILLIVFVVAWGINLQVSPSFDKFVHQIGDERIGTALTIVFVAWPFLAVLCARELMSPSVSATR